LVWTKLLTNYIVSFHYCGSQYWNLSHYTLKLKLERWDLPWQFTVIAKVHPVGTEASVSKPAWLQSWTHFCPTCKECGFGKTMCTITRLCDYKGGPTFEHLQSLWIYWTINKHYKKTMSYATGQRTTTCPMQLKNDYRGHILYQHWYAPACSCFPVAWTTQRQLQMS
jgi:hypothetical protein